MHLFPLGAPDSCLYTSWGQDWAGNLYTRCCAICFSVLFILAFFLEEMITTCTPSYLRAYFVLFNYVIPRGKNCNSRYILVLFVIRSIIFTKNQHSLWGNFWQTHCHLHILDFAFSFSTLPAESSFADYKLTLLGLVLKTTNTQPFLLAILRYLS